MRNGLRPLADYGITTFVPTLFCMLALSGEAATALHAAICAVVAEVGGRDRLPNRIKIGPLKLPRFSPWDRLRYTDALAQRASRLLLGGGAANDQSCSALGLADP